MFRNSYILDVQILSTNKLKMSSLIWLVGGVGVAFILYYITHKNMYITVDDIKNEISFYNPVDNRYGNKKVGLIHAYFVSFYNIENDEKVHLKNGETLKVKRGCYTMKDIEKVSSDKIKYNSLTGKSVIDPTISQLGPYMKKILGINNGNYMDTLLSKNIFSLTLFDMGFFEPSVIGGGGGGGMRAPHHNFVVIAPIIMKFCVGIKLDVFYIMVTKNCHVTTITSL